MNTKQFSMRSLQSSGSNSSGRFSQHSRAFGSRSMAYGSGSMAYGSGGMAYGSGGMAYGSGGLGFNQSAMGLSSASMQMQGHEKQAMQNLNERLHIYLQKVQSLENANAQLEIQIRELQKGKAPTSSDYESYYAIIVDLRAKIITQIMSNASISLEIDNARLAADDFKTKWDNEFALRTSVEADIDNLHGLHEEYMMASSSMQGELELLQDELNFMKKNHAEEVAALKAQIAGSNMSIEVDAKSGPDIQQMLEDMRRKYEVIMEQNRVEAEQAFQQQVEQVQQVVVKQNQAAVSAKNEVTEVRQSMQSLQIELGTLQGQIASLENTLDDTKYRKQQELESYLIMLERVERDFENARMEINTKKHDYAKLLDEKMKLETEIETYRRLLNGGGSGILISSSGMGGASKSGGLALTDGMSSLSSNTSFISASQTSNLNAAAGNRSGYSSSTSYTSSGNTGGNSSSLLTSGGTTGGIQSSSYKSGGTTGGIQSSSYISGGTSGGIQPSSYASGGFISRGSSSSTGTSSSMNGGMNSYSMERKLTCS
uniref:IF rod domain-containing protein n=1 Tax=Eptatretus burgeri TaxID=7764 RepID=A0A8C4QMK6_EPTBU